MTPESSLPSWLARRMRCASPPREAGAGAVEREVVEADVEQEPEAALDLAERALADGPLGRGEGQRVEVARGLGPRSSP